MSTINSQGVLPEMITNEGVSVALLSQRKPILLVFLRHFGCTFCREALQDLADRLDTIHALGAELVLVHMSDDETFDTYAARYGLQSVQRVADPSCRFYQAFGLTKGTARQLFGLHSWIRGFQAGVVDGHGVGTRPLGDGFQMPGVFVIEDLEVKRRFIHKLAGDRPEYVDLLTGPAKAIAHSAATR